MEDNINRTIRVNDLKIGYPVSGVESGFSREGITFSAARGEMVALIGRNGIGKSTLLNTMAGFIKPLGGEILWNGTSVDKYTPGELARMISFVSTEKVGVSYMRVEELVAYGRFPHTGWLGKMQPGDYAAVEDALAKTGMTKYAGRQVSRLSDGERQRALIARAVAQDTPFILLDEPTAFLDVNSKYEIFHVLHQLTRQHGKTILLSTHDLNIALREMDKFWLMTESASFEGAPEDAVLRGWLNRLFDNPLIGFDASGGDFFFTKHPAGKASVDGEGDAAAWTIRAMERRGYSITQREDAEIRIRIIRQKDPEQLRWELTCGGQIREFVSIHDMLKGLNTTSPFQSAVGSE